jgi:hypothetical protein
MTSVIDLSQEPDDVEEAELHKLTSLGTADTKFTLIVGTQYYVGEAHAGEYVNLEREPQNPYDRNAIKVLNQAGQKVGHIKKELAQVLSPLMRDNTHLQLDATIPRSGNKFTIPIQIDILGPDPNEAARIEKLLASLRFYQVKTQPIQPPRPTTVVVQARKLKWEDQQKELDDLFQKQSEEQLKNLPDLKISSLLTANLVRGRLDSFCCHFYAIFHSNSTHHLFSV